MHPNPQFYKYHWRIFWRGSPCDGEKFFETEPLATKAAFELMKALRGRGEPFWSYNAKRRRLGVAIWDFNSPKLINEEWAPAYDDDLDPVHESGHR
jgi:hypothetical protein